MSAISSVSISSLIFATDSLTSSKRPSNMGRWSRNTAISSGATGITPWMGSSGSIEGMSTPVRNWANMASTSASKSMPLTWSTTDVSTPEALSVPVGRPAVEPS